MSFRNPALVEIFTESHVEPGSLSTSQFFEVVPRLKTIGFGDVEIDRFAPPELVRESPELLMEPPPRVRCWSSDRKHLVQLWQDTIAVNLVGTYPGWIEYYDLFCRAHEAAKLALGAVRVDSLALTTLDHLSAPLDDFTVGKYLKCGGSLIPSWYADTREAFDISLGKGLLKSDGFNRVVKIAGRTQNSTFEIDIRSVFHNVTSGRAVTELLLQLHQESNRSFESLITPTTIDDVMGGLVDARH